MTFCSKTNTTSEQNYVNGIYLCLWGTTSISNEIYKAVLYFHYAATTRNTLNADCAAIHLINRMNNNKKFDWNAKMHLKMSF